MKVQLFTADGVDKVTEPLLIPDFNQFPDVVFWGTRVFIYDMKAHNNGPNRPQHYVEAFAYSLPDVLDDAKASNLDSDGA